MADEREPELEATIRRMEAAQRTIEERARDHDADLTETYLQLDDAIRDYEAAVPRWREQQAQR